VYPEDIKSYDTTVTTDILPSAVTVVYAPVDHETDTIYHLHALKSADRGLVTGIVELALYVHDGSCKFPGAMPDGCAKTRLGDRGSFGKKRTLCGETGSCSLH